MKPIFAAVIAGSLLAGCVPAASRPAPALPPVGDAACNANSVQSWLGQRASPELGARLLTLTGAKVLRWVPPRTAVTMDFRADRLTVSYDDNMAIDRISCG